jgi:hypothetical protein
MGEAKRRRDAVHRQGGEVAILDRSAVAQAVRIVVEALPRPCGGNCLWYAALGTSLLQRLGLQARLQIGEAAWRVGPGDFDVVGHAQHMLTSSLPTPDSEIFHAWIRVNAHPTMLPEVVDLTTWQLQIKAANTDRMDGYRTMIKFCPDYLWVAETQATRLSIDEVADANEVGLYSYVRKPNLEYRLLEMNRHVPATAEALTADVLALYHATAHGTQP